MAGGKRDEKAISKPRRRNGLELGHERLRDCREGQERAEQRMAEKDEEGRGVVFTEEQERRRERRRISFLGRFTSPSSSVTFP